MASPGPIPADLLLAAYANGLFPMADNRDSSEIFWVEPEMRAILDIDRFHLSRSLARTVRRNRFSVTVDTCFIDVVLACAAPAPGRADTWINPIIVDSYQRLFARGNAHSVECWRDGQLLGGLYGVSLGRAFFGESMFSRATDASKVALAWLVARLRCGGFTLLDCQFQTEHLHSLGATELSQSDYLTRLHCSVSPAGIPAAGAVGAAGSAVAAGDWSALDGVLAVAGAADRAADGGASAGTATSPGHVIAQLLTNTS